MTVKSSISLTNQQDEFARALVQDGRYSSLSAVVQQGLDLLRQKTEAEEADVQAIRTLIAQRRAGSFVPANEMKSRVTSMLARKRRDHGLDD